MGPSIVPDVTRDKTPHVIVIGNHKGGSGKSTFAMHIIIALLKAKKRVASFDLDSNQLTLSRYIGNRRDWGREHKLELELPDHTAIADEAVYEAEPTHRRAFEQFTSQLKKISDESNYDFVIIDTPGGAQHLSLVAHGLADTLITPINDSLVDLDVLVAIEPLGGEPQPSRYANAVRCALEARQNVCGLTTDWIVIRNRLETVRSRNHRQITQVLEVIQDRLGFRTARGLLERPVYREFFAAGLTALDDVEGLHKSTRTSSSTLLARLEVQELMREIVLIEDDKDLEGAIGGALREIEAALAEASATKMSPRRPAGGGSLQNRRINPSKSAGT
jgi:chromosome partitioning protein